VSYTFVVECEYSGFVRRVSGCVRHGCEAAHAHKNAVGAAFCAVLTCGSCKSGKRWLSALHGLVTQVGHAQGTKGVAVLVLLPCCTPCSMGANTIHRLLRCQQEMSHRHQRGLAA
jgi:hypothetical protein